MTRIIAIEGNIGSGKSTFINLLKNYFKKTNTNNLSICFLEEPIDVWNSIKDENDKTILECLYSNTEKYSFAFQMMALISYLDLLKESLNKNYDIIFIERSLYCHKNVFCKMLYDSKNINLVEYTIYNRWFNKFIRELPNIEYIYIKTDPNIAYERVIKRNRIGENINLEYLKKCNDYHNNWLNDYDKLVIDGNNDNNTENLNKNINTILNYINPIIVTFDGASRGNPGLSGAGYVLWKNNDKIYEGSEFISNNSTNNYAEYKGLILALKKCNELNIKNIIVKGDSKLVIQQLLGNYKVNSDNLKILYEEAIEEKKKLNVLRFLHIDRKLNKEADRLANLAIDNYITPLHI